MLQLLLVSMSLWVLIDERIAVKGGSDDPREEGDEADDEVPGGDDMASFGMIGLPIEYQKVKIHKNSF